MKAKLTLNNPMWQTPARRKMLDQAVQQSAAELEGEIKQRILKSRPAGRTYRRGPILKKATKSLLALGLRKTRDGKRVIAGANFHRASAPGQPPAVDTGGLLNSIRAKKTGEIRATVTARKNYAEALDSGSRAPSRRGGRRSRKSAGPVPNLMGPHRGGIAPRPFFRVTVKEFLPRFKANILALIGK